MNPVNSDEWLISADICIFSEWLIEIARYNLKYGPDQAIRIGLKNCYTLLIIVLLKSFTKANPIPPAIIENGSQKHRNFVLLIIAATASNLSRYKGNPYNE